MQTLFTYNWLILPQYVERAYEGWIGNRFELFANLNPLLIFVAGPLLLVSLPLLLMGAWVERRSRDFAPWFVYAVTLFTFTALVSAVHVPFGTFIHSAVALVPHAYLLALLGTAAVVGVIATRRPSSGASPVLASTASRTSTPAGQIGALNARKSDRLVAPGAIASG